MKKVSALVIALIFLLCMPVYAEETPANEIVTVPEAASETATESENSGDCRVQLEFDIIIPNDAMARGLDPVYRVGSSYVDDNGETWYVTAWPKAVRLKETECTVQRYLDLDTDDSQRQLLIKTAVERLGCPYAYGKTGPNHFDCSGFINYCMNGVGVTVPRSSYAICTIDAKIDKSMLKAGDILAAPGHVGLYIGNGMFIHAQDHGNGVVTDFLDVYNANSYKKFKYFIDILD